MLCKELIYKIVKKTFENDPSTSFRYSKVFDSCPIGTVRTHIYNLRDMGIIELDDGVVSKGKYFDERKDLLNLIKGGK